MWLLDITQKADAAESGVKKNCRLWRNVCLDSVLIPNKLIATVSSLG